MPFTAPTPPLSPPEIDFSKRVFPVNLPDDTATLKSMLHATIDALHSQQVAHEAALKEALKEAQAAIIAAREDAHKEAQAQFQATITRLIEQIKLARHRQFGASADQLSGQARLFDEAEVLAQSSAEAQDIAPVPPAAMPATPETTPTHRSNHVANAEPCLRS